MGWADVYLAGFHPAYPIFARVCYETGLTPAQIRSPSRRRMVVRARNEVMRLCREQGMTLKEIGVLVNRDHTTVMHGIRRAYATMR